MTIDELIKDIDMHLPGNRFDNAAKTMWINEVEGKIFDEIEKPALSAEGVEMRCVRKQAGKWVYVTKKINELPEPEATDQDNTDTESTDTEQEDNPGITEQDVRAIDPLNTCCYCCDLCDRRDSGVYELVPYHYPEDATAEVICPNRFCDVYVHYVLAKMHAADSETDEYNNEVLLYDASYKDYAAWHIRNFRRKI